jgi:hypothetical protein
VSFGRGSETFSQLAERINALGARLCIAANKWSVSVSVNKPESLKAVGAYLRENGLRYPTPAV